MGRNAEWLGWRWVCLGCAAAVGVVTGSGLYARAGQIVTTDSEAPVAVAPLPEAAPDDAQIIPTDRVMCCIQPSNEAPVCVRMDTATACTAAGGTAAPTCARCRIAITGEDGAEGDDAPTTEPAGSGAWPLIVGATLAVPFVSLVSVRRRKGA